MINGESHTVSCRNTCKNGENKKSVNNDNCSEKNEDKHKKNHDNNTEKREKESYENSILKATLFFILLAHTIIIYILIRIKKIKNINCKLKDKTIIFISEIVKFIISCFFYSKENQFNIKIIKNNLVNIIVNKKLYLIYLMLPSILYYIQNILFYISVSNLPIPLFQLLHQFRIFVVLIFTFLILKKKIKREKILSILFLFLSLISLKDYGINFTNYFIRQNYNATKHIDIFNIPTNHHNITKYKLLNQFNVLLFYYILEKKTLNKHVLKLPILLLLQKHEKKKFKKLYSETHSQNDFQRHNNQYYIKQLLQNNKNKDKTSETKTSMLKQFNINTDVIKNMNNNIIVGIISTFLITFISGFSSVFLEYVYINYKHSFWLQNLFLSFFTIIISLLTKNLTIYFDITKSQKKDETVKLQKSNRGDHEKRNEQNIKSLTYIPLEKTNYHIINKIIYYFYKYFNSFTEFIYVSILIFLNGIGGIITSVYIIYAGSFSKFFITPISLVFNIYISSIYFKDFEFTVNYLVSLVFVFFSLYLFFKDSLKPVVNKPK
ncbi:UDP-N-acetyl glucosamine:UMP antiporter, putative [Plasmodium berghei]|uniref:UDP-N-acetylglucosamine transporter, putative n=2 Tax=Plasmodium berghei TaxID=5821 RepID=A0A509AKG4_PLABA|nr:UDP-N-acetylglucosamine transporter, putative [Plasmodium berghei ANKA]CXI60046.1 UDP-N-acetyl glucosamine:UMP antiporter, putative [Plasmodium berghei]SCM23524.1 UDP-N-acetyl glucosamine:UMP antiporter, putative [Plasmodium berghei]SCN26632.1 UDP-N-acetyl glucosamine:UMP antiporter, putative [Plasmodium berghei]SCO60900.1 UDP-N-acetyl glucosamine:UMP antiporter, putative [Plasmodium berghei]SCO62919.1 UDP-N-acetyl glucosamine:UMP antiporter, putative [Plasmodium berghei]|eukprot:XP_034422258.1 UDP-N-acetylglucosamine transporter, putative [Plasmodium berghei ANKA]